VSDGAVVVVTLSAAVAFAQFLLWADGKISGRFLTGIVLTIAALTGVVVGLMAGTA
jgi:hypothetical protein